MHSIFSRHIAAAAVIGIALFTASTIASAAPYFVDYSFASGLGATSAINNGDNLVPRAYPSTSSNPTLAVAGGQLTLGTQASSPTFGTTTPIKIAGVRPLFGGFDDPSRLVYAQAMVAAFNPWVEVSMNIGSMALATSEFFLWGNGAPADFGIGIKKDGSYRVFSNDGYKAFGTNTDAMTLRMQINDFGFMEYFINGGLPVFTSTTTYASLSNAVSGSLTMEMRTAGTEFFDSITINNFSFGSNFQAVPEPGSLALVAVAMLGAAGAARRRRGA